MKADRITIHCSDTDNGKPCPADTIKKWHVEQNGWSDIGYHMIIQPDGEVEHGRSLNVQGAHVSGTNKNNLGICLIGRDKFTVVQMHTLRSKLTTLCMTYSIPEWAIYMHHQYPSALAQGKTCPNIPINQFLAWWLRWDMAVLDDFLLRTIHNPV